MFTDLGHGDGLLSGPEPGDPITAGDHRLTAYGIAPHRTANILGLAQAFAARPDRYDEIALTAEQAIARLAELPHIGSGRARAICSTALCSTALGHDDVLPDLARRDGELRRRLGLS
jgi:3-methyladenine DNA glycosylase/8-oxoguanine DNA glycosylase